MFFWVGVEYQVLYVDVWQVDLIGFQFIGFDNLFYFGYIDFVGYGGQWIEVVCGFVEEQVVGFVCFLGFDQGYVGGQ